MVRYFRADGNDPLRPLRELCRNLPSNAPEVSLSRLPDDWTATVCRSQLLQKGLGKVHSGCAKENFALRINNRHRQAMVSNQGAVEQSGKLGQIFFCLYLGESVANQGQLPIQGIQILLDEMTINGSGNSEAQGQQHQGGGQGE